MKKPKRNTQSTRLWEQRTSDEKTTNRVAEVLERNEARHQGRRCSFGRKIQEQKNNRKRNWQRRTRTTNHQRKALAQVQN